MPTPINPESDDLDKLKDALRSILASVSSFDNLLVAFGLHDMPRAQKYGILFGVIVFTCTVAAVITLLVLGGSFKRIAEQSGSGEATVPDAVTARSGRPLLLERLLEAREWMMKTNYPTTNDGKHSDKDGHTNLTKMLLNVAPNVEKIKEIHSLVDDDDNDVNDGAAGKSEPGSNADQEKKGKSGGGFFGFGGGSKKKVAPTEQIRKYIPEGYEENYVRAYRKCRTSQEEGQFREGPRHGSRPTPEHTLDVEPERPLPTDARTAGCMSRLPARIMTPRRSTARCFFHARLISLVGLCVWKHWRRTVTWM